MKLSTTWSPLGKSDSLDPWCQLRHIHLGKQQQQQQHVLFNSSLRLDVFMFVVCFLLHQVMPSLWPKFPIVVFSKNCTRPYTFDTLIKNEILNKDIPFVSICVEHVITVQAFIKYGHMAHFDFPFLICSPKSVLPDPCLVQNFPASKMRPVDQWCQSQCLESAVNCPTDFLKLKCCLNSSYYLLG